MKQLPPSILVLLSPVFLTVVLLLLEVDANVDIINKIPRNLREKRVPVNVIISFVSSIPLAHKIRNLEKTLGPSPEHQRRNAAVVRMMKDEQNKSQGRLLDHLRFRSKSYKSFWISNIVFVQEASLELIEELATFPEVSEIVEEKIHRLNVDLPVLPVVGPVPGPKSGTEQEWGIKNANASGAQTILAQYGCWNKSKIIVANIDSGVE
jgi:hypothetical protein